MRYATAVAWFRAACDWAESGSERGFEERNDVIRLVARRIATTRNVQQMQDVVQEATINLLNKMKQSEKREELARLIESGNEGYLYRTVENAVRTAASNVTDDWKREQLTLRDTLRKALSRGGVLIGLPGRRCAHRDGNPFAGTAPRCEVVRAVRRAWRAGIRPTAIVRSALAELGCPVLEEDLIDAICDELGPRAPLGLFDDEGEPREIACTPSDVVEPIELSQMRVLAELFVSRQEGLARRLCGLGLRSVHNYTEAARLLGCHKATVSRAMRRIDEELEPIVREQGWESDEELGCFHEQIRLAACRGE